MFCCQNANGRRLVEYQDPEPISVGGLQLTAGSEHFGSFAIPLVYSKSRIENSFDKHYLNETEMVCIATLSVIIFLWFP